ncbi:hypothetical protein [Pseudomonas aeruginosa]
MNIEVTGSNNIVAGRDFIENHLKLGNEEIRTLAAILAEEINSRPNETWSPPLSANSDDRQVGKVSSGDARPVLTNPARVRTFDEFDVDELEERLRYYRKEWLSGLIRFWLNTPTLLMLVILLGMVGFLAYCLMNGYFWLLAMDPERLWIPTLIIGAPLCVLGVWMSKIRRRAQIRMTDAQAMIDQIEVALLRKQR